MKTKYLIICLAAVVTIFGSFYVSNVMREGASYAMNKAVQKEAKVVVIDAGHGGNDPGKVGVNQALEKDINLSIAKKLKVLLEQNGLVVLMTREEDNDLAEQGSKNRKVQDMKARVAYLAEHQPVLAVSIHQNSYPSESCKGAQVFYYKTSTAGENLAMMLQEHLQKEIHDGNKRQAKANGDYYLLKHSPCTFAIVECGFLSNPQEADLLLTDDYQEKMAFAIHLGIMEYINSLEKETLD